jgi:hypothetical protein
VGALGGFGQLDQPARVVWSGAWGAFSEFWQACWSHAGQGSGPWGGVSEKITFSDVCGAPVILW